MKIGIVIGSLRIVRGGAERFTHSLMRGLVARGHTLTVMCTEWDESAEQPGATLVRIERPGRTWDSFAARAREVCATQDCDVVYGLTQMYPQDVHRFGGGVYAYWFRRKYGGLFPLQQYLPRVRRKLAFEKTMYAHDHVRHVVAISQMDAQIFQEYFHFPPEKVHVVYNGFDMTYFHPGDRAAAREEVCHRHDISATQTIVLFAANNYVRKGLPALVRALRALAAPQNYCLIVIGKPHRGVRQRLRATLGDTCPSVWCDHVEDPAQYYRAADVMVLPTQYDSFANVIGEALLCGTPVITTQNAGGAEMIDIGENGFVVDDTVDHEGLVSALERFRDRDLCAAFSAAAPRRVAALTIAACAQNTERVLQAAWDEKKSLSR